MEHSGISLQVIEEIIALAQKYRVEKVILFGSRARGDWHTTSDIDLAICGGDVINFTVAVEEDTTTLLQYDIVNLDGNVQIELLDSIRREGKILYEKV